MLRSFRQMAPLLSRLLFGAVVAPATVLATGTMAGCADENSPDTWVERLEDPRTAPAAVKRLIQFFEDAMTRDQQNREGEHVKPLLDKIIPPLTKMCTDGKLNEQTRSNLIKFLSDARDPRAEACYVKVLEEYKPDTNEDDVRWVARAVTAMDLKAASGAMFGVFKTIKVARPKASTIYRDVNAAVLQLAEPSWEADLIKLLERPIPDKKDIANLKNEAFWQITAAECLGTIKSEKAIKPLIKTVLSPVKADIAPTAVNALIKIGKPVITPAVALLKGEDKELADYSAQENLKVVQKDSAGKIPKQAKEAAEKAHIMAAAIILGTIGHKDAVGPLLEILKSTEDDLTRAVIARELPKLPQSDETKEAFKEAFTKTPLSLLIPPGNGGREALLEAAVTFYDPSFVPFIVDTAVNAKGDSADLEPVRQSSLEAAMKLMKKDQIEEVQKLYNIKIQGAKGQEELGKAFKKEFEIATKMLNECDEKLECYLARVVTPEAQKKETQFMGIKAAYMVGALGSPDVRAKLIEAMPKLENAAVKFVSVSIVDRYSPNGDEKIADQLQEMVTKGEESRDSNLIASNAPFKTIIYRLRARLQ